MTNQQCIHRSGCPKPDVCREVGHCTSMTAEGLKMQRAALAGIDLGCPGGDMTAISARCPKCSCLHTVTFEPSRIILTPIELQCECGEVTPIRMFRSPVEPKLNATPGAAITGESSELWTEGSRLRELQPVGQDFDKDLAHLDNVRATMADMKRYGSLQGIPMQEADFLLSFIDNLWREYSRCNGHRTWALQVAAVPFLDVLGSRIADHESYGATFVAILLSASDLADEPAELP